MSALLIVLLVLAGLYVVRFVIGLLTGNTELAFHLTPTDWSAPFINYLLVVFGVEPGAAIYRFITRTRG